MATWTTPTAVHSKCGETFTLEATKAIDDNTSTYWKHNIPCYHWIILDLGQTKTVSKVRVYQSATASQRWGETDGLDVFVSDNPASFGSAVWTGALDATGWQESGTFSKDGRYIKLVSKSNSQYQRMYEFDAYTAPPMVPLAGVVGAISTVAGHLKVAKELLGEISPVSTLSAVLGLQRPISGLISATTSVSATLTKSKALIGAINAASTVQGDLTGTWLLEGSIDAVTNISGELDIELSLSGGITASSSVTGSLELEIQLLSSTNFGTSNYAGPTGAFITYGDPNDFMVFITSTADPSADVGEIYIGSTNPNSLIVYNSGHGRSEFRWAIPDNPYDEGDLTFAGPGGQTV
ncbi:discoidin domain-containing protein, partial [candidate division WOR-3 bacterium]|nr:discoidin domain-containing protein [candidate division WOR-3 bacterium]